MNVRIHLERKIIYEETAFSGADASAGGRWALGSRPLWCWSASVQC
jgi:hypothetical protein